MPGDHQSRLRQGLMGEMGMACDLAEARLITQHVLHVSLTPLLCITTRFFKQDKSTDSIDISSLASWQVHKSS